jgi:hypothetical protein
MGRLLGMGKANGKNPILAKDREPNSPAEPEIAQQRHGDDRSGASGRRQRAVPPERFFRN